MESVEGTHTRQIGAMSEVIHQQSVVIHAQSQAIDDIRTQTTLLGTRLQHTQLHINQVDARMPAASAIAKVLLSVVTKVNEVIAHLCAIDGVLLHLRSVDEAAVKQQEANQAILMLSDLEAINMELALGDFAPPQMVAEQDSNGQCNHEWNILCDHCFFADQV